MAGSGMLIKLACVVLVCMVVIAPHAEAAISCGTVATSLAPCVSYLRTGGQVSTPCYNGVKSLYSATKTTVDRRTACTCMKTAAASVTGINLSLASSLPSKCGVNIPYKISPSTDCSKVQ
ncbi:Non-specific lipid-transfer protein Lac s 1 [Camellia lanceoleosa]|uniref:Non-specific lipid-transfer protein Lac s 1 n=1 Tax=Camellia lanceoleosa TaxID=1840588 RepID=A0ACC0HP28_9ERIC|nr:Non-specific lipid-transfer protein Lac s 1 [Camellia lanceoleosa]